ncbi:hypothetical protein D1AOALGA4SA_2871 [Olavius algarvensis Delta 1 endosymbiont]|nr:hypothetical protein D1AOALGA4SA_2871 [Olavius algarvensis Delta 1 endosymbiont]
MRDRSKQKLTTGRIPGFKVQIEKSKIASLALEVKHSNMQNRGI